MPDVDPTLNDPNETPAEGKKPDQAELGNAINAAVSSHMKRFMEKQLPTLLESATKPLLEQIAALKAAPASTPAPEDKTKVSPELAAMAKQIEDLKASNARSEQMRIEAEKKAREDRAFADFKGYLAKSVRPDMLDMVARDMFHNQKLVEVGEDGTATFKGTRTNYGITEEVAYPLKDGVENWLKGDTAKPFQAAPGTSNTPTARKQVTPFQFEKTVDVSKLNGAQKAAYASELEQQWAAKLAASGQKIS